MEQTGDQYTVPEPKMEQQPRPPSPTASECSLNLGLDDDIGSVSMRGDVLRDLSFRGTPLPNVLGGPPDSDIDSRSSHHPHHPMDPHQRMMLPNTSGAYAYSHTGGYPNPAYQSYGHPYPTTSYAPYAPPTSQPHPAVSGDPLRQGPPSAMPGYGPQYPPTTSLIGAGPQTYPYNTPYNPSQHYNSGPLPPAPTSMPSGGFPPPPPPPANMPYNRLGQTSPSLGYNVPPPSQYGYTPSLDALREYERRYYAEYYSRWYMHQLLKQQRDQGTDRNARHRSTPLKYPTTHSRVSFGPRNQLITVVNGTKVLIQTFDTSLIDMDEDEHHLLLSTWPGPLIKGFTDKAEVIEHLTTILSHPKNFPLQKVWHLLIKLLRQNGHITGAELADLILPPEDTQPHPEDSNEMKFRKQLLLGKRKTALDFASKYNLWGHAFALTYLTQPNTAPPDKSMVSMLAKFITKLSQDDSLIHCLYRCLLLDKDANAGISRIPISDLYQFAILLANDCAVNDCWDSADEVIKLIVALRNGNGQHLIKVERTFDSSQSVQDLSVAHDFLLASLQYGRPIPNPSILDTLLINEVWEFSRDLVNANHQEDDLPSSSANASTQLFIYNLVPYKLVFAAKLYDFGLIAQSLRYCEQIKAEYQSFGTAYSLSQQLRSNLLLDWAIVMKVIQDIETRCGKEWVDDSLSNSGYNPPEIGRSDGFDSVNNVPAVEANLRSMSISDSMHAPETPHQNQVRQQGTYGGPSNNVQYKYDRAAKTGPLPGEVQQNFNHVQNSIQETRIPPSQHNGRNRSESQESFQGAMKPPFPPVGSQNQQTQPPVANQAAHKRAPKLERRRTMSRGSTLESEADVIQENSELDGFVPAKPAPPKNLFIPTYPPPEPAAATEPLSFVSEAPPTGFGSSQLEDSIGAQASMNDQSYDSNRAQNHDTTNNNEFKPIAPPTSSGYPGMKPPLFDSPASPIPRYPNNDDQASKQFEDENRSWQSTARRNSLDSGLPNRGNDRAEGERSSSRNSDRTNETNQKNQDTSASGVFGFFKKLVPQGPKQMKLPDDSDAKIVWDPDRKMWVDKTANDESSNQLQDQIKNGPPKMPPPGAMAPPPGGNQMSGPPSMGPPGPPGGAGAPNAFQFRNLRRPQYVDVLRSANAS